MIISSVVAAIIFLIVAVGQAVRYFSGWAVTINGTNIPLSISLIGIVIPAFMAIWLLYDCCTLKKLSSTDGPFPDPGRQS